MREELELTWDDSKSVAYKALSSHTSQKHKMQNLIGMERRMFYGPGTLYLLFSSNLRLLYYCNTSNRANKL